MSEISKQALKVDNTTSFPNNTTGYISPTILRAFNVNMIDSLVDEITYNADSASWNVSISKLNTYTASFSPSLTQLNAFTASQLTINSGVNQFTQSATGRLNSLEAYTASFTTSVGIYDENTFVNNVNQINFSGNGITASFVSGKAVVSVNFTPLNDFTASTTTTLNALQSNFNSYTSSTNNSIALLNGVTGSYATTGSNIFTQNQFFEKNVSVTQSLYVGQNIYVQGGIEATYIKTIYETSSVIYSSGSNQLGDALADTQILSGSTFIEGELYVNKLNVTSQFAALNSFTASQLSINTGYNTFTASTQSDLTSLHQTTQSLNAFTASQLLTNNTLTTTASFNQYTSSTDATLSGLSSFTGSYATTGSNVFVGNQTITGSTYIATNNIIQLGDLQFGSVYKGTILATDNGGNVSCNMYGSQSAEWHLGIAAEDFSYVQDYYIQPTTTGILFNTINTNFGYEPFMHVNNIVGGAPLMTKGLGITGSLSYTGSVYGNVISQSIVSSTASIDLSAANFFTVVLPATTTTRLNITNPAKGQTAMIQIQSNTQASASFSSNVKQPSGFAYIPSSGSSDIDVLTLACFDGTNVLVTNVTKLV